MPETATVPSVFVKPLAAQLGFAQWAVLKNLEGISDEEALRLPQPGGNSINWITGHLITPRQAFLKAFGQAAYLSPTSLAAYTRGSKPGEQMPETLDGLRDSLIRSHDALIALISNFDDAALDAKAPFSPGNDPNETVGTLLGKLVVHEGYHAGQIGMARRLVGKAGAIQ